MGFETVDVLGEAEKGESCYSPARCRQVLASEVPPTLTVQHVPGKEGTNILAWIASTPLLVSVLCWTAGYGPALYGWLSPGVYILAAYFFYLTLVSVENFYSLSPVSRALGASNRAESTSEVVKRITENQTMRIEILMSCYSRVAKPGLKNEGSQGKSQRAKVWSGKTVFPVGDVIDTTSVKSESTAYPATWLSFGTRLEFLDERTRREFNSHVDYFMQENMTRGDEYEVTQTLVLPQIEEAKPVLHYANPGTTLPARASTRGFWLLTCIGLTLPYRAFLFSAIPTTHVVITKRISSYRGGSTRPSAYSDPVFADALYPTLDIGA